MHLYYIILARRCVYVVGSNSYSVPFRFKKICKRIKRSIKFKKRIVMGNNNKIIWRTQIIIILSE